MISKISNDFLQQLRKQADEDGIQKLVVGGVIVNHNSALVLRRCENEFMPGLVELPSGGIDIGEDIIQALIREIEEETNLAVKTIESYISHFDYTSNSGKKTRQFNFKVTTQGNSVTLNPAEHDWHKWLEFSEIESTTLNISNHTKEVLAKALYGY